MIGQLPKKVKNYLPIIPSRNFSVAIDSGAYLLTAKAIFGQAPEQAYFDLMAQIGRLLNFPILKMKKQLDY